MSSQLTPYVFPIPIHSSLFKSSPDVVPPIDELESLHVELKTLKQKTLERAKKAGEDLRTIEESMRRMKEKEKGKAKAIEKIKRELPLPDSDELRLSGPMHMKSRPPSVPSAAVASSSGRSSLDPRRPIIDDLKKKKKKRKRDLESSDQEPEPSKIRKATPPVIVTHSHPTKTPKVVVSSSHASIAKVPAGPDFTVPLPSVLIPPRPPIPPPPIPGPSRPTEVIEDFSKAKQPAQVLVSTFYTSIEPWIRGMKEEDIGFLEYTGDEVEPYIIPKLGRHYLEVWEEEDTALYGGPLPGFASGRGFPNAASSSAPVPKWDPSTLAEPDLVTEERGHGPLTERLVSALLPMPDMTVWKGVKAAEDAMEGRPGGYGAAMARREKVNVSDLEDRIKDTMRFHGLLDGNPNYSEKVDDAIATALRQAQRELRTVVATNKARKERLAAIARDRLGYQEYLDLRDSIDKNISSTYNKLQKKDVPKMGKKKKKSVGTAGDLNGSMNGASGTGASAVPPPNPAAIGLNPDEENRLTVSDQLKQLVDTRRKWVDTVGGVFKEKQRDSPGRIWSLPKGSVYEGIEEVVKRELERLPSLPVVAGGDSQADKGKAKVRGEDMMDVG